MTEKQDIERRERLKEWFKSDPAIWQDIYEEIKISCVNEANKLKSRECTNRDFSAGYVSGQEFILDIGRWLIKSWIPPIKQSKT